MGTTQVWWFVARAAGITAWAAAMGSVVVGLILTTHDTGRTSRRPWAVDVHRALSGVAALLLATHIVAVIADTYEHFTIADVVIPYQANWRPGAVAWGVLAMYVLIIVEVTSLARRRMPHQIWRRVHQSSLVLFWAMTAHAFYAGADARNPALLGLGATSGLLVAYLTWRRVGRRRSRAADGAPNAASASPYEDRVW